MSRIVEQTVGNIAICNSPAMIKYKQEMLPGLHRLFPGLSKDDLLEAIDYSILNRFQDKKAELDNSYTHQTQTTTAFKLVNYVLDRKPIYTASGTLYQHHGAVPNPFYELIDSFIVNRDGYKKKMKSYPKGSSDFAKYNLFQIIEKVCANAMYGASGLETSVFYSYYMANGITAQGRSLISSAIMMVEEFLSNNVKFESFNEINKFINDVCSEKRCFDDSVVLDEDIDIDDCLVKLVGTCGFNYIPTFGHIKLLRRMLGQLSQQDINRLYYRNNLYSFCDNEHVLNVLKDIMSRFSSVYMDPNEIPDEVREQMDYLYDLLHEYVYHPYIIQDATVRSRTMIRDVSILTDTDSTFVSLEGWYRYLDSRIKGMDIPLRHIITDEVTEEKEEDPFPEVHFDPTKCGEYFNENLGFDYDADEIIERECIVNPEKIGPERGVKISIVNIMSNIVYRIQKEYMRMYCDIFNTVDGDFNKTNTKLDSDCIIILKNEFALKKSLIKTTSKTYATIQERQEECLVPEDACLDIKGMIVTKSIISERTKNKVKAILYNDVLNVDKLNMFRIIEKLSIVEKEIYNSLRAGDTYYYKPARIKSMRGYQKELPYTFRSAYAYENVRRRTDPAIDLTERNTIILVNTVINESTVDKIKDDFPEVYENILKYFDSLTETYKKTHPNKLDANGNIPKSAFKPEINYIGIPVDSSVPEWCIPFIDYTQIINDNMKAFPSDDIGLKRQERDTVNFTNIVSF